jgi:hypothetical protein
MTLAKLIFSHAHPEMVGIRMTPAKLIFSHAHPEMVGIRMTLAKLSFFRDVFGDGQDSYDKKMWITFPCFIIICMLYLYLLNQYINENK